MKKYLSILFFLTVFSALSLGQNYPYKYYFRSITKSDGLSQTDIKAILQDSRGFMWFGTRNRLNRYDGHTIRVFDCVDTKSGKKNNNISSIFEDNEHRLWVGTDKGVFIYNPASEQFHFVDESTAKGVQMKDWVAGMKSDSDGYIWLVLPNQGLFRYKKGEKLRLYSFGSSSHPDFGSPECICIDGSGRLWVGTNGSGVWLYNKAQDKFVQYLGDKEGETLMGENVYTMCDYGDDLVLGIHEGKLRRLNKRRNTVTDFNAPQVHYSIIRDVKCYNDELWVGTQRGVYVINEHLGTTQHIENDAMCAYSLTDNQIGRIYRDHEGGIWIGTNLGGINYLPQKGMEFMRYVPLTKPFTISSKRIREMVEDEQGNVWIGTDDAGINVYNPSQGTFKVIGKDFGAKLHSEKTLAIMPHDGQMWVGFFKDGLDIVSPTSLQARHLSGDMLHINEASIYAMCEDAQGNVWIGNGWGVYVAPHGSMEFKRMDEFGFNYIYDLMEDSDHNMWVVTMGNGVYRYTPDGRKIKHFTHQEGNTSTISSNSVSNVMETSRGEIWFSTDRGGVCRFNKNNDTFTTFSIEQGLPDDTGYKILEDKNGMLWFGTNNGLVMLNPANGKCQVYTTSNGLPGNQFNYKSALKTRSGIFYFGSSEGLISFNPYYNNKNTYAPPVYITRLWINNNEVYAGQDGSPLTEGLLTTERVVLRHDQANISLEFAALSYVMPDANQYLYKMDGVDGDWIKADGNRRVTYGNLAPGKYVFHVKGSNSDGVWCQHEAVLEIVVLPPWWRTIWAYLAYLLLVLAGGYAVFNAYRKRTMLKSAEAQRLFEAEKEKELYQNKIDFFTSIAHEIRTPLTLINGPLENLQEMSIADPEIQRNLNTMSRNTNDLMNLINQLLDFRKMDSNKMEMYFVSVNLSSILREWVNKFTVMPLAKDRHVSLVLPEGEDLYVRADRNALIKVLNNLFSNALKYSEREFFITLCVEGDSVMTHFENDGLVIPPEAREKIFTPFYQLQGHENAPSSSGIGLYLARSLTERMDGSLTYCDHQGLNCFVLKMKRVEKVPQAVADTSDMILADDEQVPEALQSALILLVEDNVEMLNFVADKLRHNYAVETALNGVEAMQVLKEKNIDLVLSDIMMPEMDGLELCRRIKDDIELSHIPVILLTAKNDLDSKVAGLQMGADAYIEKPFAFKYLVAQITSIFENRRRGMDAFMRKPFVPTQTIGMSKADERLMDRIVQVIEENIDNTNFGVEMLAELVCMSRSSLHRKIKAISDTSPTDFIRMVRLKKASELISEGSYRVGEVCYLVGINSPSYFIKLFQKQFGMTPKEFEKQQRQLRDEIKRNEKDNQETDDEA
ncbi:MAG: response regulator [Muribaculaceae bacterium]|nr:response regulator [Muribaculaceae bacterium]